MMSLKLKILSIIIILPFGCCNLLFSQEDTNDIYTPDTIRPSLPDTSAGISSVKPDKEKSPVYVDMSDFFSGNVSVKTTTRPIAQNGLIIFFNYSALFFNKGEIVSNVLAIKNERTDPVKFFVDVTAPDEWQPFTKRNKVYELQPGDSLFIPIRIIPKSGFSGNSRYMFSAFVYDDKENFIGYNFFYAFTNKIMKWDLTVEQEKYYLLRDEYEIPFKVGLFNLGPEPQSIQLQVQGLTRNFIISDSTKRNLLLKPITFTLNEFKDTTVNMIFTETAMKRNEKMADIENFNPWSNNEIRKYNVFLRSISPNPSESHKFQSSKEIDFIRLPNNLEASKFSNNELPLSVDMNSFNVLGQQPMTNIYMFGNGNISENSALFYSSSLSFTNYDFSLDPFRYASLFAGYFNPKFNVEIGNVSGNLIGSYQGGKGVKAEYIINQQQRANLFYTQGPKLFSSPDYFTAGGGYSFKSKKIFTSVQLGHTSSSLNKRTAEIINVQNRFNLFKNHSFGVRGGVSINSTTDTSISLKPIGFNAGANYSGVFLKKKLTTSLHGIYFSPDFGMTRGDRLSSTLLTGYAFSKWTISLKDNYYKYKFYTVDSFYNVRFSNSLILTRKSSVIGSFSPLIFYNINRTEMFDVHSRGAGINLSKYDFNGFTRYFFNLNAGYNRAVHDEARNHFFLQTGGMIQYHTWSFMSRYNLGNFALSKNYYFENTVRNPQTINVSIRNQYELPFKGWLIQNMASYNYSTVYGSSANLMPEIYYFSKKGWRFRLFAEWALYKSRNIAMENYMPVNNNEDEMPEPWKGNVNLGFGIKKEFGIPIPWSKNKSCNIEFIAFYDINGNGTQDRNEKEIENVVIRLGAWEVITGEDGRSSIINIPGGNYNWNAFCLEKLDGWFSNIPDSVILQQDGLLSVPFTRGVKVSGKVFVDREKWSALSDIPLDLSKIKITAINHKTYTTLTDNDANFTFYLPKGKYVITLDEKVLGSKFIVLQNNFEFEVDDKFDNLFIPFYIVEKKRKVRITKFGEPNE